MLGVQVQAEEASAAYLQARRRTASQEKKKSLPPFKLECLLISGTDLHSLKYGLCDS